MSDDKFTETKVGPTGLTWQTERLMFRQFMSGIPVHDIAWMHDERTAEYVWELDVEQAIRNEFARRERKRPRTTLKYAGRGKPLPFNPD